jgi:hypothetical protein
MFLFTDYEAEEVVVLTLANRLDGRQTAEIQKKRKESYYIILRQKRANVTHKVSSLKITQVRRGRKWTKTPRPRLRYYYV